MWFAVSCQLPHKTEELEKGGVREGPNWEAKGTKKKVIGGTAHFLMGLGVNTPENGNSTGNPGH